MKKNKKIALIALFSALSVLLGGIENMLPSPAFGIKLGLGNITVLVALFVLGWKSALLVAILKVFLCSMQSLRKNLIFS